MFAGLGGEEGFEQVDARRRRDTGAVVAHAQDVALLLAPAFQPELAVGLPAHGVEGVGQQVDQDLFQAGLVDAQAHVVEMPVQGRRVLLQAPVQDQQRRVHRLGQAGLAGVVAAPGEGTQAGGDAAHAVDQFVDGGEVGAGGLQLAALEEAHGVAGQRTQRRQRLVEFVGDAGGHLPDHRQLASLDQFVLGLAQGVLGLLALVDLGGQACVAGLQVGGTFGDLHFQLAVGPLQRLARGEAGGEYLAPLVPGDQQECQEGETDGGQHAVAYRVAAQVFQRAEQGQVPRCVVQRAGLRQVGDRFAARMLLIGGEAELLHTGGQRLALQRLPLVQRPPVVLHAARQALLVVGAQGAHRLQAQGGVAGEDDDAVLVADEGFQARLLPAFLEGVHLHLDHRHADDPAAVDQAVGQVVARLAAGAADAVEAARLALHRVLPVGAERQVLAEVAVRVAPVAGGQDPAVGVQQVHRAAAGAAVEAFEVGVDLVAPVWRRVGEQVTDAALQLQQAGQVGVLADLALDRPRMQLQLAFAILGEGTDAGALADPVAAVAEAEHQQEQGNGEQQLADEAGLHGQ
ncbi:Uncharacterised protein [Klebsiella pneumoniae]|nr:Uncharacterised protein [Klebsiella pneumoniae]